MHAVVVEPVWTLEETSHFPTRLVCLDLVQLDYVMNDSLTNEPSSLQSCDGFSACMNIEGAIQIGQHSCVGEDSCSYLDFSKEGDFMIVDRASCVGDLSCSSESGQLSIGQNRCVLIAR